MCNGDGKRLLEHAFVISAGPLAGNSLSGQPERASIPVRLPSTKTDPSHRSSADILVGYVGLKSHTDHANPPV